MMRPVLFLDDGGVMNDNCLRGLQWQRLVAEFFAPRLGGTQEAWSEANRIVMSRLLESAAWQARVQAATDYHSFDYRYQLDWLRTMCELVNVPLPAEEACYQLALEATAAITCCVQPPGTPFDNRELPERNASRLPAAVARWEERLGATFA